MTQFSISMTTKLLASALLSIFSIVSSSTGVLANTVNSSAQNTQSNSGTVNLAPMGGSNSNYQINSVSNSQHEFGPGISCPTPELGIGAFGGNDNAYGGGYTNGATNFGATVMFTTPLGGDVGKACRELVQEITRQRQLDISRVLSDNVLTLPEMVLPLILNSSPSSLSALPSKSTEGQQ